MGCSPHTQDGIKKGRATQFGDKASDWGKLMEPQHKSDKCDYSDRL